MQTIRNKSCALLAAAVGLAMLAPASVNAALVQVTYDYAVEYSGATPPAGAQPWLRATFDDEGSAGSVKMKLETLNLVGTEFVRTWAFNLDPALDVTQLSFSAPTKVGSFTDPSVSLVSNGVNVAGGANMDIGLSFAAGGGASARFTAGDAVEYTITGIPTLTANSFNFLSSGNAALLTAAHVQGIGPTGDDSGWVTVPEPAAGLSALIALPALLRRRRG